MMLEVFVQGTPAPKGSMKAFRRGPYAVVTHDNKRTGPWQRLVEAAVIDAMAAARITQPYDGPVVVHAAFFLPKPKTVKRALPSVAPDLDKLCRAVGDALEGVLLTNDSRIVEWQAFKAYSPNPSAHIVVQKPAGEQ